MKVLDVLKSVGFWVIVLAGVVLALIFSVSGFLNGVVEFLWIVLGSVLVLLIYTLTRMIPNVDEPIGFAKKWKW